MIDLGWAIGFTEPGPPAVLSRLSVTRQAPGPGEVAVKVSGVAVNPTDVALRLGVHGLGLPKQGPPYIPGMDFSGVVIARGPNTATAPEIGTAVIGVVSPHGPHGGSYQDVVIVSVTSITTAPTVTTLVRAAVFGMNGMTAQLALEALPSDTKTLAITGAGGILGHALIVFAQRRGLTVIAQGNAWDHDRLVACGAHHVIDRGRDFGKAVTGLIPGGVDAVCDAAVLHRKSAEAVREGGVMVTFRGWQGPAGRDISVTAVRVYEHLDRTDLLESVRDAANDGSLSPRVAEELPAKDAVMAHEKFQAGGSAGRIILQFSRLARFVQNLYGSS